MSNCVACGQSSNDLTTVHQTVPGQIAVEELNYCPPCHETIVVQSDDVPTATAEEMLAE